MSDNPDQIRADIERTRNELGSDVDALADKVTPSKIVDREKAKVKNAFGSAKDRVMGVVSDVQDSASSGLDGVTGAPGKAVDQAKGNPLAVGLIAFGVGLLVASLIPASDKEKELAASAKEAAEPLLHEATDAAKEVAENLRGPATDAAESVKGVATDAVDAVKSETASAKDDVTQSATEAKDRVAGN
ncbi:uncharacterized protein DUF3618 [Glaciihabitans tibetensis]|uniref:Uncharacterized protein DUF3618 n=1 Tax=Glaciihabitans tibetensis TaxID=1266600 RepID=A0A2T0VD10_9MICO|nr:DUF3618 domain-containing protein [Glaciihabitans tibetensis]PRY68063.1 uncharacterized protein DUF3618 [Glaciihabitans tibetensis]